jgi:hypothetical protein
MELKMTPAGAGTAQDQSTFVNGSNDLDARLYLEL